MAKASIGLTIALSAPVAWALSVSPGRTELHLLPGAQTTATVVVMNTHQEPFDIDISEKPWFILPENKNIPVDSWLHLPRRRHFRLKPGKSHNIDLKISCPKNAVGELMGMVSVAYQTLTPSMVTPMISTPVYLDVIGTEKISGEIAALGAGTRGGHFEVGAQVKATGNVRLRPTGTIRLLGAQGQKIAEYVIDETTPVFPSATRDYAAKGPDQVPSPGPYTLSAEIVSGAYTMKADQKILIKENGDVQREALKS